MQGQIKYKFAGQHLSHKLPLNEASEGIFGQYHKRLKNQRIKSH